MLVKSNFDEIQDYFGDASNIKGGFAEKVFFPETTGEVAEILREANESKTPVSISGAGTGTVAGRIPHGGIVISLEKLNKIRDIGADYAILEPAVILADFQKATETKGLFYPPDPTEWSCQMGGTVATNASGARSFKYGATREFVSRLQIVLASGEIVELKRGDALANGDSVLKLKTTNGTELNVPVPTYRMPETRKHSAGYFAKPEMDAIDLFVGSEGTLGVITEIEVKLLSKPENVFSGIVFFKTQADILAFVKEARNLSFDSRKRKDNSTFDPTILEYFDRNALDFIREKFPLTPEDFDGAIFFEQETKDETEEALFEKWNELLEKHNADLAKSWFATNEADLKNMRNFRHALPVSVNEWLTKHKQRKVGTDMAVTDEEFPKMLQFYQQTLKEFDLNYVIFGHIGDNHVHVNILPKNENEMSRAKHAYGRFIARTCIVGGTISAEHGIGKLKRDYLKVMFGERYLNEMASVKKALDPNSILGRGTMFDESFLV